MMLKNELWGIRWNEERVGKSKCKSGAEEAATTEIDGSDSQDSVMGEVLLFVVRVIVAGVSVMSFASVRE
jgi:hypothetical protein